MSADQKKLLSTKDAAKLVGRSSDYVARLAREGKISARRVGRSWAIDKNSLLAFFDIQEAHKEVQKEKLVEDRKAEYKLARSPRVVVREKLSYVVSRIPAEGFVSFALAATIAFGGYAFVHATGLAHVPATFIAGMHDMAQDAHRNLTRIVRSPQQTPTRNYVGEDAAEDFEMENIFALAIDGFERIGTWEQEKTEVRSQQVVSTQANPSLWDVYQGIGYGVIGASHASAQAWTDFVTLLGRESFYTTQIAWGAARAISEGSIQAYLSGVQVVGDAGRALPEIFSDSIYVFVDASYEGGHVLAMLPYHIGNEIIGASNIVPSTSHRVGSGIRVAFPALGEGIVSGYVALVYGFVETSYEVTNVYKAALDDAGSQIGGAYATVRFEMPERVHAGVIRAFDLIVEETLSTVEGAGEFIAHSYIIPTVESIGVGQEQVVEIAEESVEVLAVGVEQVENRVENVVAEASEVAQANVATSFVDRLRSGISRFFGGQSDPVLLVNPGPAQTEVVIEEDPVLAPTNVTQNFFATTDVNRSYVDSSITSLHAALSAEIQKLTGANRQQIVQNIQTTHLINRLDNINGTVIEDGEFLDGIIRRTEITDSTFIGSNVTSDEFIGGTANFATTTLADLTVTNNITAGGTLSVAGLTSNGVLAGPYFTATSTTATSTFAGSFAVDTDGLVYATSTGNVGIGVLSPAAVLALQNSTGTQPIATFSNDVGSELFRFTNTGRLGIGTTSPYEALSVDGNGVFTGALTAGNTTLGTTTINELLVTNGTTTNASSTNLFSTNATLTNLLGTNATITSATTTNFYSSIFNAVTGAFTNFTATNGTTTNATSTNLAVSSLTAGRVPFVGTGGLLVDDSDLIFDGSRLTATNLFVTNGTTTNATSTNLSVSGSFNAVTGGSLADGITVNDEGFVGINNTNPQFPLDVQTSAARPGVFRGDTEPRVRFVAGGSNVGLLNGFIGDSFRVYSSSGLPLHIGANETTQLRFDTTQINVSDDLIPTANATFDLGSPAFYWDDAYLDSATINNLSAASTSIAGTNNASFSINSDNATSDGEDASLIFFRGTVVPNAVLGWDASEDRFDFNQNTFIQNDNGSTGTSTLVVRAASGQTGNLLTVQNNAGLELANFGVNGYLGLGSTTPSLLLTVGSGTPSSIASANYYNSGYVSGDLEVDGTLYGTFSGAVTPSGFTEGSVVFAGSGGTLTQDNNNFFFDDTNNRLGIGTTTPGSTLDVVGVVRASVAADQTAIRVADSATGASTLNIFGGDSAGGSAVRFQTLNTNALTLETGGAERLRVDTNGNVGIGTSSPYQLLSVAGQSIFDSTINSALSNGYLLKHTSGNTGLYYNAAEDALGIYRGGNLGIQIDEIGRVGIGGDLTPDFKLEVTDSQGSGYFGITESTDGDILTINSSGDLGLGTASPSTKLEVNGVITAGGGGNAFLIKADNESSGLYNYAGGNLALFVGGGQALTLERGTSNLGNFTTDPRYRFETEGTNDLGYFGVTSLGGSNGDIFEIDSLGNVGIGTTSPYAKLSVAGETVSEFFTATSTSATTTLAGGLNVGSGGLVYDWSTGNVGVGTTDVESRLTVGGDLLLESNGEIYIEDGGGNNWQVLGLPSGVITLGGSNRNVNINSGTNSNQDIYFTAGGSERVRILGTGNVGIGTATPTQQLSVWGNVEIGDASNDNSIFAYNANRTTFGQLDLYNGVTGNVTLSTNFTTGDIIFSPGLNGNVGVGTATPEYLLDVDGDFRVGEVGNANTLFVDATGGTVGIGTASPASKLDITTNGLGTTQTNTSGLVLANNTAAADGAQQISPAIRWRGQGYQGTPVLTSRTIDFQSYVVPVQSSSLTESYLTFQSSINGGAYNDALAIAASGNIGIGTTAPEARLSVRTSGSTDILNLFEAGGTEVFTVLESGNVGIGTASPAEKLHVYGGNARLENTYALVFADNNWEVGRNIISATGELLTDSTLQVQVYDGANQGFQIVNHNAEALFEVAGTNGDVHIAGSLSIATTTIDNPLTISETGFNPGSNDGAAIRVDGNWGGGIIFSENASRSGIWSANGQDLRFGTNGTASGFGSSDGNLIISSTGNVGIGTATPEYLLDVDGDFRVGEAGSSNALFVDATNGYVNIGTNTNAGEELQVYGVEPLALFNRVGAYAWSAGVGGGTKLPQSYFGIYDDSLNQARLVVAPTTGNVGIGTTTPADTLVVEGGGSSDVARFADSSGSTRFVVEEDGTVAFGINTPNVTNFQFAAPDNQDAVTFSDTSGNWRHRFGANSSGYSYWRSLNNFDLRFGVNNNDVLTVASTSATETRLNVGIGTTTPESKLAIDVAGNVQSALTIASSTETYLNIDASGNLIVGNATQAATRQLEVWDNSNAIITLHDDASSGYATLDAGIELGTGGTIRGFIGSRSNTQLEISVDDGTAPIVFKTNGGAEAARITSAGNVGIGTTSPWQELSVAGDLSLTGVLYDANAEAGSSGQLLSSTGTGTDWVDAAAAVGGGLSAGSVIFSNGSALTEDNSNFFWDDSNNRLGIGTALPGYTLDVRGALQSRVDGDNNYLVIRSGNSFDSGIQLLEDSTSRFLIRNDASQDTLSFYNYGTASDSLVIDYSGNVGIGTTTPSYGAVLAVERDLNNAPAVVLSNTGAGASGRDVLQLISSGTGAGTTVFSAFGNSGADPIIQAYGNQRVNFPGQVAVGKTSTPAAALDVNGTGLISGSLGIGTTSPYALLSVSNDLANGQVHILQAFSGETVSGNGSAGGALVTRYGNNSADFAGFGSYDNGSNFGAGIWGGTVSGAPELYIAASGNVGVGSTSPTYDFSVQDTIGIKNASGNAALELVGGSATTNFVRNSTTTNLLSVSGGTSVADGSSFVVYGESAPTGAGDILLRYGSQNIDLASADVTYQYQDTSGFTTIAKFTRDSVYTGDIEFGVNDSSPDYRFEVVGTSGNGYFGITNTTDGDIFEIDASGNVGIGTNAPETKLEVAGGNILLGNTYGLQIEDSGGANRTLVSFDGSDMQTFGTTNNNATFQGFDVVFNAARSAGGGTDEAFLFTATNDLGASDQVFQIADGGGNLFTVLGNGNVGIGSTSPDSKLVVEDSFGNASAKIRGGFSGGVANLVLDSNGDGSRGRVVFSQNGTTDGSITYTHHTTDANQKSLSFDVSGGATEVTILGNGNVGIGSTSPTARFVAENSSGNFAAKFRAGFSGGVTDLTLDSNGDGARGRFVFSRNGLTDGGITYTHHSTDANQKSLIFDVAGGTAEITILGNGNVGIGTTSPLGKLHVSSGDTGGTVNTNFDDLVIEQNGNAGISILTGNSNIGRVAFVDSDTSLGSGRIDYDHSSDEMSFLTNGSTQVTIDSSGNVGVGSTSPDSVLPDTFQDSTNTKVLTVATDGFSGDPGVFLRRTDSRVGLDLWADTSVGPAYIDSRWNSDENGGFYFRTKTESTPVDALRIDGAGNVGIGTTSPSRSLHVDNGYILVQRSSGVSNIGVLLDNDATDGRQFNLLSTGTNDSFGAGLFKIRDATGGQDRLVIDSSGNIGIGTSVPAGIGFPSAYGGLDADSNSIVVQGSNDGSGDTGIFLRRFDDLTGLDLWQNSGNGDVFIDNRWNSGSGDIHFRTKTSATAVDAVTISGDGDLGIGITAPGNKLDIEVTSNDGISLTRSGWGTASGIFLDDSQFGENGLVIMGPSARDVSIGVAGNDAGDGFNVYTDPDNTGGTDTLAFTVSNNGNVGVGTTSPWAQLSVEGQGSKPAFAVSDTSNNTDFVVTDLGRVGIGLEDPTYKLQVRGGSIDVNDNGAGLRFGAGDAEIVHSVYDLIFSTYSGSALTERVRITSGGTLAVGTTTANAGQLLTVGDLTGNLAGQGYKAGFENLAVGDYLYSYGAVCVQNASSNCTGANGLVLGIVNTNALVNIPYGASQDVFFNTGGDVGIGTSTPGYALEVHSGITDKDIYVDFDGSGNPTVGTNFGSGASIEFYDGANGNLTIETQFSSGDILLQPGTNGNVGVNTTNPIVLFQVEDSGNGRFITGTQSGNYRFSLGVDANTTDPFLRAENGRDLLLGGTEAAAGLFVALTHTGHVGVGTSSTSPVATLDVGTSTDTDVLRLADSNGTCLINPNSGGLSVSCSSDERLKSNISAPAESGLSYLSDFQIKDYTVNADGGSATGIIAQEVLLVRPELVKLGADGYYTVEQPSVWRAIQAIQELDARTEALVSSNGRVGIGTSTPTYDLHVIGDVAATSFVNISTREAKTGITYLDEERKENILDTLKTIQIAEYRYEYESDENPLRLGLIAEEAPAEVLSVSGKGVDVYKLATFTLASVQELATRVESLEDRVAALEAAGVTPGSGGVFSTSTLQSAFSELGILIEKGFAQFDKLAFRQLIAEQDNDGEGAAGNGTIYAGNKLTLVENSQIKPSSKIFVTFTSPVVGSWFITDKANGNFRVTLEESQTSDVTFDYFIVQTERDVTPTSESGVVDTQAPEIQLIGANPYYIAVGTEYVEPGVVITDNVDQDLQYELSVNGFPAAERPLDTSVAGENILTYKVLDTAGNLTTVTRAVVVGDGASLGSVETGSTTPETTNASSTPEVAVEEPVVEEPPVEEEVVEAPADTVAPEIVLNGVAAMKITLGESFVDEGAVATDDVDGDISANIVVAGAVDESAAGTYTLTYTVSDAAGNEASVSRIVTVEESVEEVEAAPESEEL